MPELIMVLPESVRLTDTRRPSSGWRNPWRSTATSRVRPPQAADERSWPSSWSCAPWSEHMTRRRPPPRPANTQASEPVRCTVRGRGTMYGMTTNRKVHAA